MTNVLAAKSPIRKIALSEASVGRPIPTLPSGFPSAFLDFLPPV